MESIFLILSGVILAAGILYWFWSHIQLTQKKVQLLENAVFELRGMMTGGPGPGPPPPSPSPSPVVAATAAAPVAEYRDLDDEAEEGWSGAVGSTPLEDLAPGGRMTVAEEGPERSIEEIREIAFGSGSDSGHGSTPLTDLHDDTEEESNADRLRQMLDGRGEPAEAKSPQSLESMPVKELRRLAEQRGIAGAADMRKKEILAALRKQVGTTVEVDLTESGAVIEEIGAN
jgi:hypothetical protein